MNTSVARRDRSKKKQLGQFMTPLDLSKNVIEDITFKKSDKVLEPSFGNGSFVINIVKKFLSLYDDDYSYVPYILSNNIYGVEYDENMFNECVANIESTFGITVDLSKTNLVHNDYFKVSFNDKFDYIIGNPPFGGTFDKTIEDDLDKRYGKRYGEKIKKETYSFFIIKSSEELKFDGSLVFICSDTFMTINTMKGVRCYLMSSGNVSVRNLDRFSDETNYGMVVFTYSPTPPLGNPLNIFINDEPLSISDIKKTKNCSWKIDQELIRYFSDKTIGDYMTCSSGMTIGNNKLFLKEVNDNLLTEIYDYSFYQKPITLVDELSKARLNTLGESKIKEIKESEENGETVRDLVVTELKSPIVVQLPHSDYLYYNKASSDIIYTEPKHAVYWKDDGDAVYTFKKNGNWYLRGVGGKKFFLKECITWSLVSSKIKPRFLPEGYILDSGSPVAVTKPNVPVEEMFFILGWMLCDTFNDILKNVINHTKNIQGKDVERMPYPVWVSNENKQTVIGIVKSMIQDKMTNNTVNQSKIDNIMELMKKPLTW